MKNIIASLFLYIVFLIPFFIAAPFLNFTATLMSYLSTRDINLIRKNLELTGFQHGYKSSRLFIRACFYHQLVCAVEFIKLIHGGNVRIEGFEEFESTFDTNKSNIIATAHLGNWELMSFYLAKASPRPTHVLAKPSKSQLFNLILHKMRILAGSNVIWVNKTSYFREILKQIKRASTIGFVMDQKSLNRAGPKVSFFGHETDFVSGPSSLAHKFDLPIIYCFAMRLGRNRYKIISGKLPLEADEVATIQSITRKFEDVIAAYPSQWVWNYRKWPQAGY